MFGPSKYNFLAPPLNVHIIVAISSQRLLGSLNTLMVYVGTCLSNSFNQNFLPNMEIKFSFHPVNLLFLPICSSFHID